MRTGINDAPNHKETKTSAVSKSDTARRLANFEKLKKKSKLWKKALQAPSTMNGAKPGSMKYLRVLCALPNSIFAFLELPDILRSITPLCRALHRETKMVSAPDASSVSSSYSSSAKEKFWLRYIETTHLTQSTRSALWLLATTGTPIVTEKMRREYADLTLQAEKAHAASRRRGCQTKKKSLEEEEGEVVEEEDSRMQSIYRDLHAIGNDIDRTFVGANTILGGGGNGGNDDDNASKTKLVHSLRNVLSAYCLHTTSIGYCQGMNFLASMFLRVYFEGHPQDISTATSSSSSSSFEVAAFCTLISVMNSQRHRCRDLFREGLEFPRTILGMHQALVEEHLPTLAHHLFRSQKVTPDLYAVSWFLTLFCNLTTLSLFWARRSMDGFLLDGWPCIHKIALSVLADLEDWLLGLEFGDICMTLRKPEGVVVSVPSSSSSSSSSSSPAILDTGGHEVFLLARHFDISPARLRRLERNVSEVQMMQRVERMLIEKNAELEREQERIRTERGRNSPEAHSNNSSNMAQRRMRTPHSSPGVRER